MEVIDAPGPDERKEVPQYLLKAADKMSVIVEQAVHEENESLAAVFAEISGGILRQLGPGFAHEFGFDALNGPDAEMYLLGADYQDANAAGSDFFGKDYPGRGASEDFILGEGIVDRFDDFRGAVLNGIQDDDQVDICFGNLRFGLDSRFLNGLGGLGAGTEADTNLCRHDWVTPLGHYREELE